MKCLMNRIDDNFRRALHDGLFLKLQIIAQGLGVHPIHEPYYIWTYGQFRLAYDQDRGYVSATYNNKPVASSFIGDSYLIPGEWERIVTAHYEEAVVALDKRRHEEKDASLQRDAGLMGSIIRNMKGN